MQRLAINAASLGLEAREPDDLAPLLGLVGNELAEVGERGAHEHQAQIRQARRHRGVCEDDVDLRVQEIDNLGGRAFGRTDAPPPAGLVPGKNSAMAGISGASRCAWRWSRREGGFSGAISTEWRKVRGRHLAHNISERRRLGW
jgi:hypothetical protein